MKSFLLLAILSVMTVFSTSASAAYDVCKVSLVDGRGFKVDSFTGYGFTKASACLEAKHDCLRAKVSGLYRAKFLTCKKGIIFGGRVTRRGHRRGTINRLPRRGGRGTINRGSTGRRRGTVNRGSTGRRRGSVNTGRGRSSGSRGSSGRSSGRSGRGGRRG